MNKVAYIFVLLIIVSGFWNLKPLDTIANSTLFLPLELAYLLYGWLHFSKGKVSFFSVEFWPFLLIVGGILFSMVPALLFHGQSIVTSILAYRSQLIWLTVPVLFKVSPNFKEIATAAFYYTIVMLAVGFLNSFMPSLFFHSEEQLEFQETHPDEKGLQVTGFSFATIPIFLCLWRIRKRFRIRDVMVVFICFAAIFLIQNRSTLFPIVLIILLSLLGIKTRHKKAVYAFIGCTVIAVALMTSDIWLSLFEETSSQVSNEDYNRAKAYLYFLSPLANPSWLTYIFGNGFLSAHSTSLMQDMMEEGIYNSDVGLVGFWNQFGIIPIIVFVFMYLYPIVHWRSHPWHLKMFALFMIAISMTTGYFGVQIQAVFFSFYYYIFMKYSGFTDKVKALVPD